MTKSVAGGDGTAVPPEEKYGKPRLGRGNGSSLSSRMGEGNCDENADAVPSRRSETLLGRTISFLSGRRSGNKSKDDLSLEDADISSEGDWGKSNSAPAKEQPALTIFISCSALIRETKLCVDEELQPELDEVYAALQAKELGTESAVKRLVQIVGSTIVQQAGLSVNNAQQGILPHGWLEYIDESSDRPYYYNVHTRETIWFQPEPPLALMRVSSIVGDSVNIETDVETHHIPISADI